MDFQFVLADLLAHVNGALGVLLLDRDGETVDVMGRTQSIHDIKVIGAYQGIFLSTIRSACESLDLGACEELAVRVGRETFMTLTLPEGYYILLVLGGEALEGEARYRLRLAGKKIEKILF